MKHFILAISITATVACKHRENDSQVLSIIGSDQRSKVGANFGGLGRFGSGCTAFAVGPRLIMTAAHCTFGDRDTSWKHHVTGESFEAKLVARGLVITNMRRHLVYAEISSDWALLSIDRAVDKWFDVTDAIAEGDQLAVVGYSFDRDGASVDRHCSAKKLRYNVISHDCDLREGASGGPVFKRFGENWKVVGIQSTEHCVNKECKHSEWSERDANKAALVTAELLTKISEFNDIFR